MVLVLLAENIMSVEVKRAVGGDIKINDAKKNMGKREIDVVTQRNIDT